MGEGFGSEILIKINFRKYFLTKYYADSVTMKQ